MTDRLQHLNALMPMLVTPLPIVTDASLLHSRNAPPLISVTELPIVTDVSPLQFLNALLPMLVTELGIVNLPVSPLQS